MKKILHIAALLLLTHLAYGQQVKLALDEHNKYVYYQVVDIPGISADSLYKNGVYFAGEAYPKNKAAQVSNAGIVIKDKFLTYTSIVKHENGEMRYTLNIEFKDSKYRYWITDLTFTPYQKDRYGVFVPQNGIDIPLEKASSKVDKKDLDGYIDQTNKFCAQLGEKLKKYMTGERQQKKPAEQPAKKIVTDKW